MSWQKGGTPELFVHFFAQRRLILFDAEVTPPRTGLRIPADPRLAVFEVVGTRRPLNGSDGLAILTDKVHQAVADGAGFSERMFFLQPFIGNGLVFRAKSDGYGELTIPALHSLPVRVSEPVKVGGRVSTWKLKIETRPDQPHLPAQRIHLFICAIQSHDPRPMMLRNLYGIDLGTSGLILQAVPEP